MVPLVVPAGNAVIPFDGVTTNVPGPLPLTPLGAGPVPVPGYTLAKVMPSAVVQDCPAAAVTETVCVGGNAPPGVYAKVSPAGAMVSGAAGVGVGVGGGVVPQPMRVSPTAKSS